jgi:glycine/D-amino acid oxidase-like deaminating enzyme
VTAVVEVATSVREGSGLGLFTKMRRHVIVIGSGLAGMTAAYELSKTGTDEVTVLEANDRIGGRVRGVVVDGDNYELGGFMIFSWYREIRRLLTENGLVDQLVPTEHVQYWPDEHGSLVRYNHTPRLAMVPPRLAAAMAGPMVSGKLRFYDPELETFNGQTYRQVLDRVLGPGHRATAHTDNLLTGFTYGRSDEVDAAVYLSLAPKLTFQGGFDRVSVLPHGTGRLLEAMADRIRAAGGSVRTQTPVDAVERGRVVTPTGVIDADAVVLANGMQDALLERCIPGVPLPAGSRYTRHYAVVFATQHPLRVRGMADWAAMALPSPRGTAPAPVCWGHMSKVAGISKPNRYVTYFRVHPDDDADYGDDEIDRLTSKHVLDWFPDAGEVSTLAAHHWRHTMPLNPGATIAAVRAAQGVNGWFYAGDYLGFPSMEMAAYTGASAARIVTSTR